MSNQQVSIITKGHRGLVAVGEMDISKSVTGVTVHLHHSDFPRAQIDVFLLQVDTSVDASRVTVPPSTYDALVALGWTPPPDYPPVPPAEEPR